MPSVSVLPSSSALNNTFASGPSRHPELDSPRAAAAAYGASAPNGSDEPESSVDAIKEKVREKVRGVRKASAVNLLRIARDSAAQGAAREAEGDVRGAFERLFTAAQLSHSVMDHPEFKLEKEVGKKGVVMKDFGDFKQQYGDELLLKVKELERRLVEMEQERSTNANGSEGERKEGGSIADRLRSLQEAGLKVDSSRRLSRDLTLGSPPAGAAPSAMSRAASAQNHNHTGGSTHSNAAVTHHHTGSSVHSLASPSAFGLPTPLGSASASGESPRLSHFTLTEFSHAFPSIDELDEGMGGVLPQFPSVPTHKPGAPVKPVLPSPISPTTIKRFPSLPLDLDPGPRPASTPIPPTMHALQLQSRPPSPKLQSQPQRSPLSPTIPPKPMGLGMNMTGSGSGSSSSARTSPLHTGDSASAAARSSRGIELPVTNTIFPKVLHEYLARGNEVKVLLLDVRSREEFARGHVRCDAVVCLEPHILLRDGMTSDKLEDALVVAPQHESAVFRNRDKFDLVVLYDADSDNFGSSIAPMSAAMRIVYETAFRRSLKRPPVILVGGLKAWSAAFPNDIARDEGVPAVAGLDLDRLKLSSTASPTINGSSHTSYVFKEREEPPSQQDNVRSPTMYSRPPFAMDQIPEYARSPTDVNGVASPDPTRRLARKPAMSRPPSTSSISFNTRGFHDPSPPYMNGSHAASSSSIVYPQYPRPSSSNFGTSLPASSSQGNLVSPPPTASINPSLSRRRSDYVDQSEQAVSNFTSRPSIDYPDLSAQHVVRPPPVAATPPSERQVQRRASAHGHRASHSIMDVPKAPMINSDYPVLYWPDAQIATTGLKNLGNTCYMNSTIQCLSATVPFARFFTDGRWKSAVNFLNPLGSKGQMTAAFASILHDLWHQESPIITPFAFRKSICMYGQQFAGSEQHDSQEFLNFLLDGLHEDLNRILNKPPITHTPEREAELEVLAQQIASQQEWNLYRTRDDSIVVDFFQGQFRNRMQCQTCGKTSTTYNSFMYLTLPIPSGRNARATLQECLDAFVKEEVMEKADAWQCPNCKTLRKATKRLSISRLPPVLLIHLKRFTQKGHFTDKLETFIDFPVKGLDLTNYMPPPLPPGVDRKSTTPISLDDPRSQIPPYKYDLYGVTNHFGTLSSGHYTAFVNSRGNWLYCDDSRVTGADARDVVGKPAYVLYYKRVKP